MNRARLPSPIARPASFSPAPPPGGPGPDDVIDWGYLRDVLGFVWRAPRRRVLAALFSFTVCVGAAAASLVVLPKTYRAEVRLLAERNLLIPALSNPRRSIPTDADAPTRGAAELILKRASLLALIEQTHLLERWDASRAPALRLKDRAVERIRGPVDLQARIDAMVEVLEKQLAVRVDGTTLQIVVTWPDADTAMQIVDVARQNFIEERHAREVAAIAETISILEAHSGEVRAKVGELLGELRRSPGTRSSPSVHWSRTAPPRAGDAPEVAQLRAEIAAKRRALDEMEGFRQRRVAELQATLADQHSTFGPSHPSIAATQRALEALGRESPQLQALRREEQDLVAKYVRRTGRSPDEAPVAPPAPLPPVVLPPATEVTTPEGDALRAELRMRLDEHHDLLGRLDAARIELDTARAGFKYRYGILQPAQVPRKPEKPNPPVTLAVGVLAGLLLAFIVPAGLDLRSGRAIEVWQVERAIGAPVLARLPERDGDPT